MTALADPRPFLVLTAIVDVSARPAAVTLSHADALERARKVVAGQNVAGIELVELTPIAAPAFAALRRYLQMPPTTVGLYDLFPLASHLNASVRRLAGQFLASEVLWTLSEQGQLGSIPFRPPVLDVPQDWDKDPKKIHEKLLEAGALNLTPQGIETYKAVRQAWEASRPATVFEELPQPTEQSAAPSAESA